MSEHPLIHFAAAAVAASLIVLLMIGLLRDYRPTAVPDGTAPSPADSANLTGVALDPGGELWQPQGSPGVAQDIASGIAVVGLVPDV